MQSSGRVISPCDVGRDGSHKKPAAPTSITRHTSSAFGYFSRFVQEVSRKSFGPIAKVAETLLSGVELVPILLVHTVFDTWRTVAQSSPSTVTADNQCAADIDLFVRKTVESSLQATMAERLVCSPSTKTIRIQSPAGSLPDLSTWESCQTMPLVGRLSRGSTVSPALSFQLSSILTSITLIDSQDLAVKSHLNLFTPSLTLFVRESFRTMAERKYGAWSESDMERALAAYRNWDTGFNECCRQYGVPRPTMKCHLDFKNVIANEVHLATSRQSTTGWTITPRLQHLAEKPRTICNETTTPPTWAWLVRFEAEKRGGDRTHAPCPRMSSLTSRALIGPRDQFSKPTCWGSLGHPLLQQIVRESHDVSEDRGPRIIEDRGHGNCSRAHKGYTAAGSKSTVTSARKALN
ncbi:hypothetical protein PR048_031240 [Dryococelus australis]|uniref:Myb-like domain-containing protein n=1 Tax=Dryococelus australis TaxID=614101 RepID=A0ABQ9G5F2_9NEOP|nr:hypothetical protein PR048_031240 [Dryococelus australis]